MKKLALLILGLTVIAALALWIAPDISSNDMSGQVTIPSQIDFRLEGDKGGANEAAKLNHLMRANQITGEINPDDYYTARRQALADYKAALRGRRGALNLVWENLGPNNVGGRTRAFKIDPTNPNRIYSGGVTGGLWISDNAGESWYPYLADDSLAGLGVCAICIAPNGDIYVGTGEPGAYISVTGRENVTNGFLGEGIWKSTDGGSTFNHLSDTDPSGNHNSTAPDWTWVSDIVAHPTDPNILMAGTAGGVYRTTDGGQNWNQTGFPSAVRTTAVEDLEIDEDGIVHMIGNARYYKGNINDPASFNSITNTGLPSLSSGRMDLAIAKSDKNYLYIAAASSNAYDGTYRSTDRGETWTLIPPAGSSGGFNPTGDQGNYNLCIIVNPADKDWIYIGGQLYVYVWRPTTGYYAITNWTSSPISDPQYVHADHHEFNFHPTNPDIMYLSTDGGIFRTKNARANFFASNQSERLPSWKPLDKMYITTQFYGIAAGRNGEIMGGTQDNGTIYVNYTLNTIYQGDAVGGGDGGFSEISDTTGSIFLESQDGRLVRTNNPGGATSSALDLRIDPDQDGLPECGAPFVAPFVLYEEFRDDVNNVAFYKDAADEVLIDSNTSIIIGYVVGPDTFYNGTFRNTYKGEGRLYFGTQSGAKCGIWVGTDANNFSKLPTWFNIANTGNGFSGLPSYIAVSNDGNTVYASTFTGGLYRITNLNNAVLAYDNNQTPENPDDDIFNPTAAGIQVDAIGFFGRYINEVAVDINDPGHVIVALGNYGNSTYIYESNVADTTPGVVSGTGSFSSVQGNLPRMPVYACAIDPNNGNNLIAGTEFGIYSSNNGGTTWSAETDGMPLAPIYQLRVERIDKLDGSCWALYAGTHGRGIYRTTTLTASGCNTNVGVPETPRAEVNPNITIFPNPAVDVAYVKMNLEKAADVYIKIYSVEGKLVKSWKLGARSAGEHKEIISTGDLAPGIYVVAVGAGDAGATKKLVIN